MSAFNILRVFRIPEVLFNYRDTMERDSVCLLLYTVKFGGEDDEGIICRVPNKKCKINKVVRVGKVGQEIEVLD